MIRRRAVAGALTLALVATLFAVAPARAAKTSRRARTIVLPYSHGALAVAIHSPQPSSTAVGYCLTDDPPPIGGGCVAVPVKPGDRLMSIEVKDLSGLPVQAMLVTPSQPHFVCGKTEAPMQVPGAFEIWLVAGNCKDGYGPSVPTMGEVVVRLW